MSGLAEVLLNLGYQVSGSDLKRQSTTVRLKKKGAKIFMGHHRDHLNSAQVVIVSSAVKENNPELKKARELNIPIVPRAELLAELMRLKYGIAIAGTHGKTTTTSLIGTILAEAGLDPTLIIGGRVNHLRSNARLGKGEFLVAEADESDRSFLKLSPAIAVITNIDPEHMENFDSLKELRHCFVQFANQVPFYGAVVACQDHPQVRKIFPELTRRLITYGVEGSAEYEAKNITQQERAISFEVLHKQEGLGRITLSQPGRHQVGNALAAIAVARELDIPFPKIALGLKKFQGISRRFEILRGLDPIVVDDYAHHPVEIEATLQAVRDGWPEHKIALVVQPHRFTRLKSLWDSFVRVLGLADWLVVLPVYPAGENPIAGITGKNLFLALREAHPKLSVAYAESLEEVSAALKPWLAPPPFHRPEGPIDACPPLAGGKGGGVGPKIMVLFLGAGDITRMARGFVRNKKPNIKNQKHRAETKNF